MERHPDTCMNCDGAMKSIGKYCWHCHIELFGCEECGETKEDCSCDEEDNEDELSQMDEYEELLHEGAHCAQCEDKKDG